MTKLIQKFGKFEMFNLNDYITSIDNCSVCLNNTTISTQLKCKHCFHERCLNKWLLRSNTCPVCRDIIIDEDADVDAINAFIYNSMIRYFTSEQTRTGTSVIIRDFGNHGPTEIIIGNPRHPEITIGQAERIIIHRGQTEIIIGNPSGEN